MAFNPKPKIYPITLHHIPKSESTIAYENLYFAAVLNGYDNGLLLTYCNTYGINSPFYIQYMTGYIAGFYHAKLMRK